jgi:hypothetical protein
LNGVFSPGKNFVARVRRKVSARFVLSAMLREISSLLCSVAGALTWSFAPVPSAISRLHSLSAA